MGIVRTCIDYKRAKGGVLRCEAFRKGRGHPVCDSRLKGGGRSAGLVRIAKCAHGRKKYAGYKSKRRSRK